MKKILVSLLVATVLSPVVFSQSNDYIRNPEIGISFNAYDFATAQRIRSTSIATVFRDKRWATFAEMTPGLSVHYFQGIRKHFDLAATLSSAFLNYPFPNRPNFGIEKLYLAADVQGQFKLVSDRYWIQPYVSGGVGMHKYRVYWGAYAPVGAGLNIDFYNESKLFVNAQYRIPVTRESANYHFLYSIGISGKIANRKQEVVIPPPPPPPAPPKDTDNDGITDDKDKCPTVPGVAKYDGCPVPDTDKDGINDDNDKCPTVPGLAKYEGCPVPDTDKDGINDEEDKCPTVPGVARYQGCPVPDTDKDGINDEEDKCPTEPGVPAQQGCPEITEQVTKTVAMAAKNVYFETASTKLRAQSFPKLDELVKVLKENPSLKLKIDGHTDNVGQDDYNMKLSDGRAASVKNYLISKGIDASRLESEGFGETKPVDTNNTAKGRQNNRRVEMKVFY